MMRVGLAGVVVMALIGAIVGCHENTQIDVLQRAVKIESSDECHLCGMIIGNFPGPKGEVYTRGQTQVKKFCSTRDLFAFLLEPENTHRVTQVFVHDMAVVPWSWPDDEAFIDAKLAYYVINHQQKGAMGPTLASFKTEADARKFSQQYGGRVVLYNEISLGLLVGMITGV